MSENANANNASQVSQTTPVTGAQTTSSNDPARATDGRFEPNQWRYPADYHISWLRGKTADEAATLNSQMYDVLQRPQAQQQPQQPQYAPQPAPSLEPTQDDWLTQPEVASRKLGEYMRKTQFEPAMNQFADTVAQQARMIVEMRDPEAFKRWGPEIDVMVQRYGPAARSVEGLNAVVDMIRGKHVNELIAEREAAVRGSMTASMRADGGAAATTAASGNRIDFDSAGLPDNYRRALERYRITPETLDEFLSATECKTRNITLQAAREEWLAKAKTGDVITESPLRMG